MPARVPLWLKAAVAKKHSIGKKAAAREAWRIVGEVFPGADVGTAWGGAGEVLTVRLPFGPPNWAAIESFRARYDLGIGTQLEGETWMLTFWEKKT